MIMKDKLAYKGKLRTEFHGKAGNTLENKVAI
jgi:hypothetical protein